MDKQLEHFLFRTANDESNEYWSGFLDLTDSGLWKGECAKQFGVDKRLGDGLESFYDHKDNVRGFINYETPCLLLNVVIFNMMPYSIGGGYSKEGFTFGCTHIVKGCGCVNANEENILSFHSTSKALKSIFMLPLLEMKFSQDNSKQPNLKIENFEDKTYVLENDIQFKIIANTLYPLGNLTGEAKVSRNLKYELNFKRKISLLDVVSYQRKIENFFCFLSGELHSFGEVKSKYNDCSISIHCSRRNNVEKSSRNWLNNFVMFQNIENVFQTMLNNIITNPEYSNIIDRILEIEESKEPNYKLFLAISCFEHIAKKIFGTKRAKEHPTNNKNGKDGYSINDYFYLAIKKIEILNIDFILRKENNEEYKLGDIRGAIFHGLDGDYSMQDIYNTSMKILSINKFLLLQMLGVMDQNFELIMKNFRNKRGDWTY